MSNAKWRSGWRSLLTKQERVQLTIDDPNQAFNTFTRQAGEKHRSVFENPSVEAIMMKLQEEVGELAGALTRHREKRDGRDWKEEVINEYGDVCMCLNALVHNHPELFKGNNFRSLAQAGFEKFLDREWSDIPGLVESSEK